MALCLNLSDKQIGSGRARPAARPRQSFLRGSTKGWRYAQGLRACEEFSDVLLRGFALPCSAEALEDRKHLLLKQAQGLVASALTVEDARHLEQGESALVHVAKALEDGKLLLLANAKGLIQLTAGLEVVGWWRGGDAQRLELVLLTGSSNSPAGR